MMDKQDELCSVAKTYFDNLFSEALADYDPVLNCSEQPCLS